MSNDKRAYDPETGGREDAFGELARAGRTSVPGAPGEHAERLARLRARTGGRPLATAPAQPEAKVVTLRPRRRAPVWWAAAAAVLIAVTVALLRNLDGGSAGEPVAVVLEAEPAAEATAPPPPEVTADAPPAGAPPADAPVAEAAAPRPPAPESNRPAPTPARPAPTVGAERSEVAAASAAESDDDGSAEAEVAEVVLADEETANVETADANSATVAATESAGSTLADAELGEAELAAGGTEDATARAPSSAARARKTAPATAAAPTPERYAMAREQISQLRRVTGTVLDEGGTPVPGATVAVEGTGQRQEVGPDGAFDLSLPPAGRVGVVTAPDSDDTLYVDLSLGERYAVAWPRKPYSTLRPEVRRDGHASALVPLPAPAPLNPAFEAYLETRAAPLPGPVELQFTVNRRGRPTGIRVGPTHEVSREAFRRARAVLEAGPDWGERWRRRRWRYVLR